MSETRCALCSWMTQWYSVQCAKSKMEKIRIICRKKQRASHALFFCVYKYKENLIELNMFERKPIFYANTCLVKGKKGKMTIYFCNNCHQPFYNLFSTNDSTYFGSNLTSVKCGFSGYQKGQDCMFWMIGEIIAYANFLEMASKNEEICKPTACLFKEFFENCQERRAPLATAIFQLVMKNGQ